MPKYLLARDVFVCICQCNFKIWFGVCLLLVFLCWFYLLLVLVFAKHIRCPNLSFTGTDSVDLLSVLKDWLWFLWYELLLSSFYLYGWQVRVVSPDKDFFQIISPSLRLLRIAPRGFELVRIQSTI